MSDNIVIGIDIGGSHITAAQIDLRSHSIIRDSLVRHPVDAKGTAEQVIRQWTDAIVDCKAHSSKMSKKIGIAMPGPFDYDKGISFIKDLDKYESLYLLNIKEKLAKELEIEEEDIYMMNDASCFLKGEIFCGTAGDCGHVIGITLGTGLGSAAGKNGIITDGDLYYTPFKDGTAEDYLSTRWFIKRYKELTGITAQNVKDIRDRVPDGPEAILLFEEFGKNLGEVVAAYCKKHNAEKIIIGGNIINAWELFIHETQAFLSNHSIDALMVKAKLGEEASLIGAGSLCNVDTL